MMALANCNGAKPIAQHRDRFHRPETAHHLVDPLGRLLIGKPQETDNMTATQPAAPLTIIAIFAGIIESSALATLPFLSEKSQGLYTWFLVGFPFFLTALFFLTLNFNYKSLYKPEEPGAATDAAASPPTINALALTTQSAGHTENTASPSSALQPVTVMLSGPDAQKLIQEHVLRALAEPLVEGGSWIFCDLDKQQCFRLSTSELPENAAQLMK